MKNTSNIFSSALVLAIVLSVGLACSKFSSSTSSGNSSTTDNHVKETTVPETKAPTPEKADFTMTAEQYDLDFTRKGVTDKDLQKYANKIIAVSGRVSLLSLEKKGTTQPWVTLFAPGVGNGVSCYFDDDSLEQMKRLKMDKMVTIQGFQDDFLVPEVSPRLEHCTVLKAD